MPTAVLIDGGYFVKRFRRIEPQHAHDAERASQQAFRWAMAHLKEGNRQHDLYRIYFYDCPPVDKRMHHPISKTAIDFSKSPEAIFRTELHEKLRSKRKVALRLGHLSSSINWVYTEETVEKLLKGKLSLDHVGADDVRLNVKQKGVDMRIGMDITALALKRLVDQIVLFAGDADFVPVAKLARREGIDFVLDPMHRSVPASLREHIDGLRSTCPKVRKLCSRPIAQAA